MKKIITLIALLGAFAIAQERVGTAYTKIGETSGTTNYLGFARTTENTGTVSTNAAVWKIIRTVKDSDGNVLEIKNAYGSGTGDSSLWTTAWTNRVSATYK